MAGFYCCHGVLGNGVPIYAGNKLKVCLSLSLNDIGGTIVALVSTVVL